MLDAPPQYVFPSSTLGTARTTDGWPSRLTDRIAATQPFLSDYCYAGPNLQTNVSLAGAGHSAGNVLKSANLAFGDGHVEHWKWKAPKVFQGVFWPTESEEDLEDLQRLQQCTILGMD